MTERFVPDAGDIVWLHFNPQAGHEQAGHKAPIVLSPASYNARTSLMICCPMTTRANGHPY
jgi:mRNA interferase MazF